MSQFFTFEGRFPATLNEVPQVVITYLAKQLSAPSEVLKHYKWTGRTSNSHRQRIRQLLSFRRYAAADRILIIQWLCEDVLPLNQHPQTLEEIVRNHLFTNRIEPPSRSAIQRLIDSAQNTYDSQVFETIFTNLPAPVQEFLDKLLEPQLVEANITERDLPTSIPLVFLKAPCGATSLNTVFQAVTQLKQLSPLNLPENLFAKVPRKVVHRFRQRVAASAPSHLRRHPDAIRLSLLAAFCQSRCEEITDDLVEWTL